MSEEATEKKPRKAPRPLNAAQKAEAIALWKAGTVTLDELAARFKRHRTTFINLFNREGIVKGESASETKKKVEAEVEKKMLDEASAYATRIKETKDEHYRMAAGIAKLTFSKVYKAEQEKRSLATIDGEIKTLMMAAKTLQITREERYAVLGIDVKDSDEDRPLPDLQVLELSADDIKEMHRQQMVQSAEDDEFGEVPDMETDLGDEGLLDAEEENDKVEIDD